MATLNFIKVCQLFREEFPNDLQFISGKWFDSEEKEIDINKWFRDACTPGSKYYHYFANFKSKSDKNNFIDIYIDFYGEDGYWYELPIVKKAKEFREVSLKEVTDIFPLDDKQITIINRMLFHPEDEVVFITTGIGGSGKSTFLNIIKQLFGNDYMSASLSDLSGGFKIAEAVQKRLICSDELAKGELNLPVIKQLASKQHIMIEPKYLTPYEIQSQSALFYCCNKAPRVDITDTGILRRIVFYERNTKIANPNPALNRRVFTEEELLIIAAYAYQQDTSNWVQMFERETHRYLSKDNSVYIYMEQGKGCVYEDYVDFCRDNNFKCYNQSNFMEIYDLFKSWKDIELNTQYYDEPF